ncbi:MAG: sigma 54-interacting transcriptional regulator [Negativicutes bacterium]|nr:sigma 54-interacting transcriptional regulator [Negativicutes bacterium]
MKVKEIMIPVSPLVMTGNGGPTDSPLSAGSDFLPVVDGEGRYIGSIDLVGRTLESGGAGQPDDIWTFPARDVVCVAGDTDIDSLPKDTARAVVVDETGRVIGTVGPVDFLRTVSHSLAEFKEQLYAIINSAQNGILAINDRGVLILVNNAAEELTGKNKDELIGRHVSEVIPNSLLPQVLAMEKPLLGQKIGLGDTAVMANYSPIIANGKVIGAVSVFQDVSILENTFQELTQVKTLSKELEAIINSSYDGMFITDGQGVVLRVNKAYERITGIRAEEVIGRSMRRLVEEKYYDQSVTLLVLESRKSMTINQTVKGDRKLLVTGNPMFDDAGEIVRVLTNVRDVTELVRLQDKLAKTQEQTLKYKTELTHLRSMQIKEEDLVYRSQAMAQAVELALKVAEVDSTVLITGESGSGKELIAKLIHKHGKGAGTPFIKINCSAIPDQLLESELFGYEGGAFTGAKKEGKPGLCELAHHGTLFLDEIGDLPLLLQAKILRTIQEKEVVRVGGTKAINVDIRIVAATNRDMTEMVKAGKFRQDLYYRLMVVPIHLAPLRERKEDIPLLSKYFVDKFNKRFRYSKRMAPAVVDKLMEYSWPGNVRELENVIERMMVTAAGNDLTEELLPETVRKKVFLPKQGARLKTAVEQTEAFLLAETYREHPSWPKVAEILGVDRATIFRKAAKYGLLKKT